jgi:hypothetical protein
MCGMLNWRGSTPFGELCGAFPMKLLADLERNTPINFSYDIPIKVSNNLQLYLGSSLTRTFSKPIHPYSRFEVTRGFSTNTIQMFDSWSSKVFPFYVKRCD